MRAIGSDVDAGPSIGCLPNVNSSGVAFRRMMVAGSPGYAKLHEVFSSGVRRRILTACQVPHSVGALAKEMGLTRQGMHRHVAMLVEQGLLAPSGAEDRRKVKYRLDPGGLRSLLQRMDSDLRQLGESLGVSITQPPGAPRRLLKRRR